METCVDMALCRVLEEGPWVLIFHLVFKEGLVPFIFSG